MAGASRFFGIRWLGRGLRRKAGKQRGNRQAVEAPGVEEPVLRLSSHLPRCSRFTVRSGCGALRQHQCAGTNICNPNASRTQGYGGLVQTAIFRGHGR